MLPHKVTVAPVSHRFTVLSKKKTITIALALADDRMLSRAAASVGFRARNSSGSTSLAPSSSTAKPTSAGIVRALTERGDERELFGGGR